MASISNNPGGLRTIQFTCADGKRRTIRLGKVTRREAEAFKVRVERLVSASISSHPADDETLRWVAALPDQMLGRLARVGLVAQRTNVYLGGFLDRYLESRHEIKPSSLKKLRQTAGKLLDYFDSDQPLRAITPNDAVEWRLSLLSTDLSMATVKQHVGNAKTIFGDAVRRGFLTESPFRHLKGGSTPSKNTRYVTPEEAERIMEACPTQQWRLLFALARFAGLRTPSETHGLTWSDIDWERGRMLVRSPKTEHHEGHDRRFVPITPRLMAILHAAFDAAPEGQGQLVTMAPGGNLRRRIMAIADNAGVERWKDAFQTLRRSCEKEWAAEFPQYAVSKWIGTASRSAGGTTPTACPMSCSIARRY